MKAAVEPATTGSSAGQLRSDDFQAPIMPSQIVEGQRIDGVIISVEDRKLDDPVPQRGKPHCASQLQPRKNRNGRPNSSAIGCLLAPTLPFLVPKLQPPGSQAPTSWFPSSNLLVPKLQPPGSQAQLGNPLIPSLSSTNKSIARAEVAPGITREQPVSLRSSTRCLGNFLCIAGEKA